MVIMSNRLSEDVDVLLIHLQQTLEFTNNLKEKCKQAEQERDSALAELIELKNICEQLRVRSLTKSSCKKCVILKEQLIQQRRLAKETQARLKSVASLLNFDDGSQINQLTEAQCALVSQMLVVHDESDSFGDHDDGVCDKNGGGNSSSELCKRRQSFSLLSGKPVEDGSDPNVLVPETVQYEVDESIRNFKCGITIPETQVEENTFKKAKTHENIDEDRGLSVKEQAGDEYPTQFMKLVEKRAEKFRAARLNRSIYRSTDADRVSQNEIKQESLQSNATREPNVNNNTDNKETKENRVLKRISPENRLSLKARSVSQKRNSDNEKPLKENVDSSSASSDSSSCLQVEHKYHRLSDENERTASFWDLKPSHTIEPDVASSGDTQRKKKKLTQMKLSVASFNRRRDVSSFENFNGGVASTSMLEDDENDIILPSPNKNRHKKLSQARKQITKENKMEDLDNAAFTQPVTSVCKPLSIDSISDRKQITKENKMEDLDNAAFTPPVTSVCKPLLIDSISDRKDIRKDIESEDLDETLFNPVVTSTCKPAAVDSSFDRIPEVSKSPPYKYRRNAVRKKVERMKLPGQQCNDCAKFYEAAGFSKEARQKAMNACSKHRDKYPILYNSPPGFWDPVIPESQQ